MRADVGSRDVAAKAALTEIDATGKVTRDIAWARKITERLRLQATNYAEARDKIRATIAEAQQGDAAGLLGYASWTAYAADVLGDAPLRLERDERRELVQELSQTGMSTRAIAPIVGVSQDTVVKDINRAERNLSPERRTITVETGGGFYAAGEKVELTDREVIDLDTGEVISSDPIEPRKITGVDGKQYTRTEPSAPKRIAYEESFFRAVDRLNAAVRSLENLGSDDRLNRSREKVARYRNDLLNARDALDRIAETIN